MIESDQILMEPEVKMADRYLIHGSDRTRVEKKARVLHGEDFKIGFFTPTQRWYAIGLHPDPDLKKRLRDVGRSYI